MRRDNSTLADDFIRTHDPENFFRDPDYDGPCATVDPAKVDRLAAELLDFVAVVIAQVIDAGSERDAVNENDELLAALRRELMGWVKA